MTKKAIAGIALLGLIVGVSGNAHADLITNGGFELTDVYGQITQTAHVTGWTTSGYNFLFDMSNVDSTGVNGSDGNLRLWGPNDGSNNGFTASPNGGNFVAADGAYEVGAITQTVSGLTVGHTYQLGFDWGAAQQEGFSGATTDKWTVSLGAESYDTSVISLPDHGFSGWQSQTFTYTATSTSELLSFLATGTPNGVPPFALLDGVTMSDVTSTSDTPEPGAFAAMFVGFVGTGVFVRRRKIAAKASA